METILKSMGAYLSKYLAKGARVRSVEMVFAGGYGPNMVPRRWWGRSRDAASWLFRYTFELPPFFVGRVASAWRGLAAQGLLTAAIWTPVDAEGAPIEGAPSMLVGRWRSAKALREALALLLSVEGIGPIIGPDYTFRA